MDDISIEMKVPLDGDGFLRRECPNCERQFKLKYSVSNTETLETIDIESYYCPYCYEPASLDSWWTKEQLEQAQQLAFKEVVEPELKNLQRQIQSLNRNDSFAQIDSKLEYLEESVPLTEVDDMVKVDFPCHPEEPLKIDETWKQNAACFVCGIQYPASLVKESSEQKDSYGG